MTGGAISSVSAAPVRPARLAGAGGPGRVVAPIRLAVVRAALAVGAGTVLAVELAGALGRLTAGFLAALWLAGLVLVGLAVSVRARRRGRPVRFAAGPAVVRVVSRLAGCWATAGRLERLLAGVVAGLAGAELAVALLAEPNNYDSQTYHLPRIEHWVAQHSLRFWPTAIDRQVSLPPGAEYLVLPLRLLTGGDAADNLVQWAAGLGCLVVATRIAAQLGGGRRAQLLTAFLVGTTPMVALQASSTQTDLVAAAWASCVVTVALDFRARPAGPGAVLALGAATGLTAVTKTTGLLAAGPVLVLFGLAQLRLARRPGWPRAARAALVRLAGIGAVAAALAGPFLLRVYAEFGHPLGPPSVREAVAMGRRDPAALMVNALRIGHTALNLPLPPANAATAAAVGGLARTIGVDPQGRDITFGRTTFPYPAWTPDEDWVAFPLSGGLILVGAGSALVRPGSSRGYTIAWAAGVLLYVGTVKWQPWGNRLLLPAVVLGAPLAGRWLDHVLRPRRGDRPAGRRPLAVPVVAAVLAGSALAGTLAVGFGRPRRLVGAGSVLVADGWQSRFVKRPAWAGQYRWAADRVLAARPRRIGLVEGGDDWEYPWWLLLVRSAPPAGPRELVSLRSELPRHPPADPRSVDAIVCSGDRAACAAVTPASWQLHWNGYVGYALPAGGS